jgi:hypothetical protein
MNQLVVSLYTLPSLAIYAIVMGAAGLAAALCCVVLARVAKPPAAKDHLDVAMRTTGAVMAALTLILAFCAVQARSGTSDARGTVTAEVTAIGSMVRFADRLGAEGRELRAALAAYTQSIARQEFPTMATSGRHEETQRLAEQVERLAYATVGRVSDLMSNDLIDDADSVEATRERRLHAAQMGLPHEFWLLIALLFGLLALTGALYPPRAHTVAMLAVQAAGCGALIAFVLIVDQPFRPGTGISASAYESLLRSMDQHAAAGRRASQIAAP